MSTEKNICGLPEGVFKACQFLGLQFPPTDEKDAPQEKKPSDYFGDSFKLNLAMAEKLQVALQYPTEQFKAIYRKFSNVYLSKKCFKHTLTDLNVYFCDYLLFVANQGASPNDYFAFEFYRKSFALRNSFITCSTIGSIQRIANKSFARYSLLDKSQSDKLFADFLHRDWLNPQVCTFEEFKAFVEKHPRFFAKPVKGFQGKEAQIIKVNPTDNLGTLWADLKSKGKIIEEIVHQHKTLAAFCPDTVNTIRIHTFLDIHNVAHILSATGKFGRMGGVVDNVHLGGGCSASIDLETGIITSDGLTFDHERLQKHPDTGKTFKGFQYPCWDKVRAIVKKMAKKVPQLRSIGWDITVNDKDEAVLIEGNGIGPAPDLQQAAGSVGKLPLYEPLLEELINYENIYMKFFGYRVNNILNFNSAYNTPLRDNSILKFAMNKLIPDCKSLMDLGCRQAKLVKAVTPPCSEILSRRLPKA